MDSISLEEVTGYLTTCTHAQLIRAVAPALLAHAERKGNVETRIALCKFVRDDASAGDDMPWALELIGFPRNPEEWKHHEAVEGWEAGHCSECRTAIASYAKEGVCPLCGATSLL